MNSLFIAGIKRWMIYAEKRGLFMPNKVNICAFNMGIGSVAVINNPRVLNETGILSAMLNEYANAQQGLETQIMGSKWSHNPTEKTHKRLPYPYCA